MAALYPQVQVSLTAARARTGMPRRFLAGHAIACPARIAGLTDTQIEEILVAVRAAGTGGSEAQQKARELAEVALWVTVMAS